MQTSFTHTQLGKTGLNVHRLGFSGSYNPGKKAIYKAFDAGLNYFFCDGFDRKMVDVLRKNLKGKRENYVIASGAFQLLGFRQNLRKSLEKRLRQLNTDYLDVFYYLSVPGKEYFNCNIREELCRLKKEGKTRFIGISTHDRKMAGKMAGEGNLDIIMMRYNAAHRGAEEDIFPHLSDHHPGIVSYTATRWQKLLERPPGWAKGGKIPTADLCYRFVLSNPHVHVCLTAPSSEKQLEENLRGLDKGPLLEDEMEFIKGFGDAVHSNPTREILDEKMTSLKMSIRHLLRLV